MVEINQRTFVTTISEILGAVSTARFRYATAWPNRRLVESPSLATGDRVARARARERPDRGPERLTSTRLQRRRALPWLPAPHQPATPPRAFVARRSVAVSPPPPDTRPAHSRSGAHRSEPIGMNLAQAVRLLEGRPRQAARAAHNTPESPAGRHPQEPCGADRAGHSATRKPVAHRAISRCDRPGPTCVR